MRTNAPPQRLALDDFAVATGTTTNAIERFIQLGIVSPDESGAFASADVRRVRLVSALETSGISVEVIASAVRDGRLSLDFIDQIPTEPVPLLAETQAELMERVGISPELGRRLASTLGTSGLARHANVRADQAELFQLVAAEKAGGVPDERLARLVQSTADGVRRIVEAQRDFFEETVVAPLRESTLPATELLARSTEARRRQLELGQRLTLLTLDRFVDEAIFDEVVIELEAALGDQRAGGSATGAIAFMDMSGYTTLAEEVGDEQAVADALRFSELVIAVSAEFRGELVKVLGDGVMVHFNDAENAVRAGLAVIDRLRAEKLPSARVGINAGSMIRRGGDYFGTVVNVAARAADVARSCEVVVTTDVVEGWRGGRDVHFSSLGAFKLRHVRHAVELYKARRETPVPTAPRRSRKRSARRSAVRRRAIPLIGNNAVRSVRA
jgi:adenylate cyclase